MLFPLLQTTPSVEEVATQAADSVAVDLEQFAHNLITNPSGTLEHLGQDIINFGLKLLAALAIYLVGAWLIRRIKKALGNMFAKRKTEKALASFIMSFTTIGLTILLIIISISTLGVDTTSIAALIAAAGVAIGMALSGTVENFAGGIMILAFKPFKAGDYIEAQGYEGTVTAVSIVSTTITTYDNKAVILPNGTLFNGNISNYSRFPLRRVDWKIGVEYGTDSGKCIGRLLELVKSDPRVLDSGTPGAADPTVSLSELGDSAVVFSVKVWVKTEDYWGVLYDYNKKVYDELPKAGIDFPFPQMDVHVHNTTDSSPATARNR